MPMIIQDPNDTLRFKKRPQCGLLIENSRGEVLLQLRDDKPAIPFPNCWGTFGGQIEEGELPQQAIIREIKEELAYRPQAVEQYGIFPCDGYDIHMFRCVDPDLSIKKLEVHEGQRAGFFSCADIDAAAFAFNCREIMQDYFVRFHHEEIVFIGLGSNMGNRAELLKKALALLAQYIEITAASSIYETEPVDYEDQGWFLNMAVQGRTRLFPEVLLEKLQKVETELGRQRAIPKGPRTMDLDILFYGTEIVKTDILTVPHPDLHNRAFVLAPLAEIAPGLVHPVLHKNTAALLAQAGCGKRVIKKTGDCFPKENGP
jgi:2-amino-4-hydroxy-6-hydroxymethyldihydropteridine diphosphokinase